MSEDAYSNLQVQKAVLKEALVDWKYYLIGITAMFAGVQARLTTPIFLRLIIDDVIIGKEASNLLLYSLAIIGIALISGIFNYGNRYFNDRGGEETILRLRDKLFSKIQEQSLKFLYEQETGQLMTRATADLEIIKNYLRREFRLGLDAIYYYISIGLIIYFTQPSFLLIFAILLPFLFVISYVYAKKSRPLFAARRDAYGDISSKIQEDIMAVETIRSFSQESREKKSFHKINQDYKNLFIRAEVVRGLTLPLAVLIVSLGSVAVLFLGGIDLISGTDIITGTVTLGMLVQFNLYLLELTTPTRLFGNFLVGYTRTNVSGKRVFEILWSENEIKEDPDAIFPDDLRGEVSFEGVSFEYDSGLVILEDLNLEIPANSTVAIFGSTGSGKSTLINLIPRFFDPTSGTILIDGIDVKVLQIKPLRKFVSTVSQDIFLFSRTIRENIAFGKSEATLEDVIAAAKAAQIHDFITSLPDGYDTYVGERGVTLSGGQQQRMTIARAILVNPRILVLDDSTSSVDAETEFLIQETLGKLMEERTTIIITQKVSSARFADKIVVLDSGTILEEGTHEELIASGGIYMQLYETQRDRELEESLLLQEGD